MDDRKNEITDLPVEKAGGSIVVPEVSAAERERSREELAGKLAVEMDRVEAAIDIAEILETEKEDEKKRASRLEMYDWIQSIVSTLVIVILAFIFIGRQTGVDGISMRNTLHNNDSVFVTGLFYKPHYGDIVIIRVESYGESLLVKRVIATEGQTVDINFETNEVFVDGVVLNEPYIREPTRERHDFSGEVTVPEGCIFVMGDNRNSSRDSRDGLVGFVDVRDVIGKVRFVIFPGKDKNSDEPRDWSHIGSVYKTLP